MIIDGSKLFIWINTISAICLWNFKLINYHAIIKIRQEF